MFEKIQELKEQYTCATTEKERENINKKITELCNKNPDIFADAMQKSIEDTAKKATKLAQKVKAREQLKDVIEVLPLSYIAKHYFNKSRQWLYQRLNEYKVNGTPAKFTAEEIDTFNNALQDLSKKISSASIT